MSSETSLSWQSRLLVWNSGSKGNKWTKERTPEVPVRVCSTRERNFIHLPFTKCHSGVRVCLTGTSGEPHGYCTPSQILQVCLADIVGVPHGYFGCASQVLHTLTGTAHTLYRLGIFWSLFLLGWVWNCFSLISYSFLLIFPLLYCFAIIVENVGMLSFSIFPASFVGSFVSAIMPLSHYQFRSTFILSQLSSFSIILSFPHQFC